MDGARCFACNGSVHPRCYGGAGRGSLEGDESPAFCSDGCAVAFAVAFVRAGHRLVRNGQDCTGGVRPVLQEALVGRGMDRATGLKVVG